MEDIDKERYKVIQGNVKSMPLLKNQFDVITMFGTKYYFKDAKVFIHQYKEWMETLFFWFLLS